MSEFMGGDPLAEPAPQPVLRVVRGYPTPEELAAIVAVLAASGGDAGRTSSGENPAQGSNWAAPARSMRHHYHPVPGHLTSDSWWQSGMPT